MKVLTINNIDMLNHSSKGPMLSLYLSVDTSLHTSKTIDQRFRDLLNKAEFYLLKDYPRSLVNQFIDSLNKEHDNLISRLSSFDKGIAIFQEIKGGFIDLKVIKLQSEIQDLVIVANSFHVKPLLRIKKYVGGYFILTMSSRAINVMIENRGDLVRIESYRNEPNQMLKEKKKYEDFFSDSAAEINKLIQAYRLPVVLCGVRSHIHLMKQFIEPSLLLEDTIIENIEKIKFEDFQMKVNEMLIPYYAKTESNTLKEIEEFETNPKMISLLEDIAVEAIQGNVAKLFVLEKKYIWGSLDKKTGKIEIYPKQQNSYDDDLLDDLCQMVLSKNGEVVVVRDQQHFKENSALALVRNSNERIQFNSSKKKYNISHTFEEGRI